MRKLRLQLIGLLVLVALLPAIPAWLTVGVLFQRSLGSGAEEELLQGARAGLAGVRDLLRIEKDRFSDSILAGAVLDTLTARELATLEAGERNALENAMVPLVDSGVPERAGILAGPERASIRGRDFLVARIGSADKPPVLVTAPLPANLVERAEHLMASVRILGTLKREHDSLVRGLVLTFLAVYGATLILVAMLGLLLATRLTRPLQSLGKGIDSVAEGDLSTRVQTDSAGHLARLFTRFNRMTERLRAQQEELLRLEQLAAWRNLARRLAHEIKNPLTPIQLASQQIRDAYPGGDPEYSRMLNESVAIVEEEVHALRNLVREFSEFARLPEPVLRDVPASALIGDISALYGEDRVSCLLESRDRDLCLRCDPDEIHRVLINLINNALQAQEESGATSPVALSLGRVPSGSIVIEVRDRGPGIPPPNRRRVFTPDYSTKSEGMGLGLAIVESIVSAHAGVVEIDDHSGGGAIFRIALPANAARASGGTSKQEGNQ